MIELLALDIVIVDLELDDGDGFSLLRALHKSDISSIVISVRQNSIDRVLSLELGANDYMIKPIELRELYLRVKNVVDNSRARRRNRVPTLDFGPFSLNLVTRAVYLKDGREEHLTSSEITLLQIFLDNPRKVVERATLARALSKWDVDGSRSLDMMISKLRLKLSVPGKSACIKSVRGVGYIFDISEYNLPQGENID